MVDIGTKGTNSRQQAARRRPDQIFLSKVPFANTLYCSGGSHMQINSELWASIPYMDIPYLTTGSSYSRAREGYGSLPPYQVDPFDVIT